jgi:hypothetical protein
VYFLQAKNQAFEAFRSFQVKVERQTGKKIKILRTDNGREYVNDEFRRALEHDGIRHQKACPYTPEQNGTAERMNRTLVEKARCLLNDARMKKEFWAEAVSTAAYLVNRSPTRSIGGKTPEEIWTGRKPNLKHLRVFGSTVMVHVPKVKRKKFNPKALKGVFVGYCENTKGYRVYDAERNDFLISRDVVVVSESVQSSGLVCDHEVKPVEFMELLTEEIVVSIESPVEDVVHSDDDDDEDEGAAISSSDTSNDDFEDASEALPPQQSRPVEGSQQGLRRSGRERTFPGKYGDFITYGSFSGDVVPPQSPDPPMVDISMEDDPQTYDEVMRRPDRILWIQAMKEEIASLGKNQTWTLTDLPEGRKAIRNKWVFKTKRGPDGSVQRYKARLVVKGCSQKPGIDYEEVYSPVVRYSTIRYLMALAVKFDLDVDQMDVVTAFLQGELGDEELYMVQPEGFEEANGKVCQLKKALYGLKQSSRVWNGKLDAVLREFGLQRSQVDTCLYWMMEGDKMLFVTIYVDDLLIFTNNRALKKKLKKFLMKKFDMKDLGEAAHCLGIRIERDRPEGRLSLDQQAYIEEIVQRFGMADATPVATPADPSLRLDKSMAPKTDEQSREMTRVPYKEAVGCLSFVAQTTRPDIAYAVNAVSQFSANPGRQHWEATKRIIRYLKGTASKRLQYTKDESTGLEGYCDADWGGDPENRRSTKGYLFTMQGAAISWCVKKQPTVALSSCEAEFMSLSQAIQEAMWWRNLRSEFTDVTAVPIHCDNQSAISIVSNGSYNPRTKHISIRYHFVHEALENKEVKLEYISTANQPADGFTKPMTIQKQTKLRQFLGVAD